MFLLAADRIYNRSSLIGLPSSFSIINLSRKKRFNLDERREINSFCFANIYLISRKCPEILNQCIIHIWVYKCIINCKCRNLGPKLSVIFCPLKFDGQNLAGFSHFHYIFLTFFLYTIKSANLIFHVLLEKLEYLKKWLSYKRLKNFI